MVNEYMAAICQQSPYCNILAMIPQGAANARYSDEIAPVLGMSKRMLSKNIEHLRRNGVVIIGDTKKGYYLPQTITELETYIAQETKRAKSILYTLKSAKTLRNQWLDELVNEKIPNF